MNLSRGVPKPVFKRTHSRIRIPESVKLEVRIRSGNKCEGRRCANRNGDQENEGRKPLASDMGIRPSKNGLY